LLYDFASDFNGWCWVVFCRDSNGSAKGAPSMAKTGIDGSVFRTAADNTTDTDWRSASAELAFVAECIGTEQQAEELLRDAPIVHGVRWRCADIVVRERRDHQANPPIETPLAAARLFFWHRGKDLHVDVDTRVVVDWPANCAYRVGPVVGLGWDGGGNSYPIADVRALSEWTATGICYHHGDVVNMLVKLELMPRPPAEAEPATEPAGAESAESGLRQRPAHRVAGEIPHWSEAMEELKRQRERRLDLVNKPTEQARSVVRWLAARGVEIVESSSKRAKDVGLNPNIVVLSERQLIRRIDDWFAEPKQPE
jgi:hypothetical protein